MYSNFSTVPAEPMPSNVTVLHTVGARCYRHALGDLNCPVNTAYRESILSSRRVFQHVALYQYYHTSQWADLPFPFWRTVADDARWMRQAGIDGSLTELSRSQHPWWAAGHMTMTAAMASLRDPDFDVDAWLKRYCMARFGGAGEYMLLYYRTLEEAVMTRADCLLTTQAAALERLLPDDIRMRCSAVLDRAAQLMLGITPFHAEQVQREMDLFERWCYVLQMRRTVPHVESVTPRPFPGWEAVLQPQNSANADAVLLSPAYLIPSEKAPTYLRLYRTATDLYFCFECLEPFMTNVHESAKRDYAGEVFRDDNIEIFTAEHAGAPRCAHYLASITGAKAASDCDVPGHRWNWHWQTDWEVRVKKYADRWILAARIPRAIATPNYFTVVRNRLASDPNERFGFPDGGAYFTTANYAAIVS